MARRKLPYVVSRARRDGTLAHRGYADDADGKRVFSETFDSEEAAYQAALRMRGEARNLTDAETLDEACEGLLADLRLKRTKGTVRWYADHLRAVLAVHPRRHQVGAHVPQSADLHDGREAPLARGGHEHVRRLA